MTVRTNLIALALVAFSAFACVPTQRLAVNPPTITALAHGVTAGASVAVAGQQVLVGETMLGARPGDTTSHVTSVTPGSLPQVLTETLAAGEITGLALAGDGTIYVSRRAPDVAQSTVQAYRAGHTSVVIAATGGAVILGTLRSPAGLAMGATGDLVVADPVGSQVLRVNGGGKIDRLAGTGPCNSSPLVQPTPGDALYTALCGPELVAVDGLGVTYVARKGSRWVVKIDNVSQLSIVANDVDVAGLAIDPSGSLLVSDATRGAILRYRGGQSSVLVDRLHQPTSLAVGADGAIYVLAEQTGDLLKIIVH